MHPQRKAGVPGQRQGLERIRDVWRLYRRRVLTYFLLFGFLVNLLATFSPSLSKMLEENTRLTFAFFLLVTLLVVEAFGEGEAMRVLLPLSHRNNRI